MGSDEMAMFLMILSLYCVFGFIGWECGYFYNSRVIHRRIDRYVIPYLDSHDDEFRAAMADSSAAWDSYNPYEYDSAWASAGRGLGNAMIGSVQGSVGQSAETEDAAVAEAAGEPKSTGDRRGDYDSDVLARQRDSLIWWPQRAAD